MGLPGLKPSTRKLVEEANFMANAIAKIAERLAAEGSSVTIESPRASKNWSCLAYLRLMSSCAAEPRPPTRTIAVTRGPRESSPIGNSAATTPQSQRPNLAMVW